MRNLCSKALICMAMAAITSCHAVEKKCTERSEDTAWQKIGSKSIQSELRLFNQSDRTLHSAKKIFGDADVVETSDQGSKMFWSSGSRRTGRTYSCDRLVNETHHVSFAVLSTVFQGDEFVSCELKIAEYIGGDAAPNPYKDRPISVEKLDCHAFK